LPCSYFFFFVFRWAGDDNVKEDLIILENLYPQVILLHFYWDFFILKTSVTNFQSKVVEKREILGISRSFNKSFFWRAYSFKKKPFLLKSWEILWKILVIQLQKKTFQIYLQRYYNYVWSIKTFFRRNEFFINEFFP